MSIGGTLKKALTIMGIGYKPVQMLGKMHRALMPGLLKYLRKTKQIYGFTVKIMEIPVGSDSIFP